MKMNPLSVISMKHFFHWHIGLVGCVLKLSIIYVFFIELINIGIVKKKSQYDKWINKYYLISKRYTIYFILKKNLLYYDTCLRIYSISEQRKSVTYDELMESNLTLDNERLQLEICRIKKETEKLNEEVQLLQTKRLYLQLKMEKEFQLTPVFDESK